MKTIGDKIIVFHKCGPQCPHYVKKKNAEYCDCEGRVNAGPCYRCGGI